MASGDKHKVNLFQTVASRLKDLPIADGNIIFTTDTKVIYFDAYGTRLEYCLINTFETEADRKAVFAPVDGYYWCADSNVLYNYKNGSWHQLTPSNLTPTVLGNSVSDFPEEGDSNVVYFTHDATYRWVNSEYEVVSNKTTWGKI